MLTPTNLDNCLADFPWMPEIKCPPLSNDESPTRLETVWHPPITEAAPTEPPTESLTDCSSAYESSSSSVCGSSNGITAHPVDPFSKLRECLAAPWFDVATFSDHFQRCYAASVVSDRASLGEILLTALPKARSLPKASKSAVQKRRQGYIKQLEKTTMAIAKQLLSNERNVSLSTAHLAIKLLKENCGKKNPILRLPTDLIPKLLNALMTSETKGDVSLARKAATLWLQDNQTASAERQALFKAILPPVHTPSPTEKTVLLLDRTTRFNEAGQHADAIQVLKSINPVPEELQERTKSLWMACLYGLKAQEKYELVCDALSCFRALFPTNSELVSPIDELNHCLVLCPIWKADIATKIKIQEYLCRWEPDSPSLWSLLYLDSSWASTPQLATKFLSTLFNHIRGRLTPDSPWLRCLMNAMNFVPLCDAKTGKALIAIKTLQDLFQQVVPQELSDVYHLHLLKLGLDPEYGVEVRESLYRIYSEITSSDKYSYEPKLIKALTCKPTTSSLAMAIRLTQEMILAFPDGSDRNLDIAIEYVTQGIEDAPKAYDGLYIGFAEGVLGSRLTPRQLFSIANEYAKSDSHILQEKASYIVRQGLQRLTEQEFKDFDASVVVETVNLLLQRSPENLNTSLTLSALSAYCENNQNATEQLLKPLFAGILGRAKCADRKTSIGAFQIFTLSVKLLPEDQKAMVMNLEQDPISLVVDMGNWYEPKALSQYYSTLLLPFIDALYPQAPDTDPNQDISQNHRYVMELCVALSRTNKKKPGHIHCAKAVKIALDLPKAAVEGSEELHQMLYTALQRLYPHLIAESINGRDLTPSQQIHELMKKWPDYPTPRLYNFIKILFPEGSKYPQPDVEELTGLLNAQTTPLSPMALKIIYALLPSLIKHCQYPFVTDLVKTIINEAIASDDICTTGRMVHLAQLLKVDTKGLCDIAKGKALDFSEQCQRALLSGASLLVKKMPDVDTFLNITKMLKILLSNVTDKTVEGNELLTLVELLAEQAVKLTEDRRSLENTKMLIESINQHRRKSTNSDSRIKCRVLLKELYLKLILKDTWNAKLLAASAFNKVPLDGSTTDLDRKQSYIILCRKILRWTSEYSFDPSGSPTGYAKIIQTSILSLADICSFTPFDYIDKEQSGIISKCVSNICSNSYMILSCLISANHPKTAKCANLIQSAIHEFCSSSLFNRNLRLSVAQDWSNTLLNILRTANPNVPFPRHIFNILNDWNRYRAQHNLWTVMSTSSSSSSSSSST